MVFKAVTIVLLSWLIWLEVMSNNNAKSAETTFDSVSLKSISKDLDAAQEIFKHNYELWHEVTIDHLELEQKPEEFEGSYFVSGILKLKFTFKKGNETVSSSVLLKIPQIGAMYKHGEKMFYYSKEKYMYEDVIPQMYENVPYEKPSPDFYGSTDSGILVLEDIRESGYRGFAKGTLLNLAQCEAVWKALAQFHALSTTVLDKVTAQIDKMSVMDRCQSQWITEVFPPTVNKLKKHVLPHCPDSTNSFLDNFLIDFCSRHINPAFSPNTEGRNVILHGDFHLSNILFKQRGPKDEIKCKFIDWQISRRGSPVIDLMYFTVISVHFEVFDGNREALFNLYVREFSNTLEKIGVTSAQNSYTLADLKADWEKYKSYLFFVLIGVAPPLWAGDHKTGGLGDGEENSIDVLYKSDKYRSAFRGWIKHFLPAE